MGHELTNSISVVIPTFGNRKKFLIEAINSVVRQTLRPSQIVIVNNGGYSLSEIDLIKAKDVPITIIDTVYEAGASQARNIGATIATGHLIAFLDDDDLWESNYLEEMFNETKQGYIKCVITRIAKVQENEVVRLIDATEYLSQQYLLLMNPGVTGSNILIDRKFFLSLGGYDCSLPTGEDGDLILKVMDSGTQIAVCGSTQAVMRVHNGERLTDSKSLAKGYKAIYFKYRNRVGTRDTTYLIWRYKREEYRSEKRLNKLPSMLFWSSLVILMRRTPRSINK
jgi:glycosyltransferase involved in cell wall biosynthesis